MRMNGTGKLALMSAALSILALFFDRGKMLRVLIAVLLTASLVPLTGCGRSEKRVARNELEQLNIPYNRREFFERVRQSDAVAVDLFLAAGMNANLKWGEAMRIAAAHGHTDIVKMLIAGGGDVNARAWFRGETALCRAAYQGHISTVEELLDAGATIEGCGCENSILAEPAEWGQIELVRLLLDHGAGPNVQHLLSDRALLNAVRSGHAGLVRLLLERGADPNVERRYGTALINAIGTPEILRDLLQSGADVNGRDREGETALIRAAYGWAESHQLLLEYGADVNARSYNGTTALMKAAEGGNAEIVRILLRNGADVDAKNKYGGTALLNAMEHGHTDVVRLLENPDAIRKETSPPRISRVPLLPQKIHHEKTSTRVTGDKVRRPAKKPYDSAAALVARKELVRLGVPFDKKSFVDYARQGDSAMTKLFLNAGINPDAGDHNVGTALMAAAENGDMAMVRLLVESGADPNKKYMPWGDTMPLMYAVDKGDMEMTRLLLDHGADVNAKDFHGYTALMRAANKGQIEIARLLLDQKPDVNAKMDGRWGDGSTALYHAVIGDHAGVVRMLLESGADVNTDPSTLASAGNIGILRLLLAADAEVNVRDMGSTPLLNAARYGHAEMVRILLDHGADLNSRDEEGQTDLMIAVRYGYTDAVRLLLDAGAEINASDHYGQTALMYAAWQGDTALAKTLLERNADPTLKDMYGLSARSRARFRGHLEMEKLLETAMGESSTDETNEEAKMLVFLPVYDVRVRANFDVGHVAGDQDGIAVRMSFDDVNRQTVDCRDIELPVTIRIAAYTTDKEGYFVSHEGIVYRKGYVITGSADVIRIPGEAVKIKEPRAQAKKVDAHLEALVAVPYHKTIRGWSGRKLVWNLLE